VTTRVRVAITGCAGQLGHALLAQRPPHWDTDALDLPELDICDWHNVSLRLAKFGPDLVIHAAAATDVDRCEREPEWAYQVNALGTRNVARATAQTGASLVYVSTNYVFDGEQDQPYHEFDQPNPISYYGASKLAGEYEAAAARAECWIVRTAMLYAPEGRNFVNTMRRLMAERENLSVVHDQFGNPTFATDLADAIIALVERAPAGIYHAVNAGQASWYDWATEIKRLTAASVELDPIPASAFPRDAMPPRNGALTSLALPAYGIALPDWRDALSRALRA
jgi:dTDP-4-dehydrorhamnose reductase